MFDDIRAPAWFGVVYGFSADLLVGALLLALFPRFSPAVAARAIGDPLASGGVGLLALLLGLGALVRELRTVYRREPADSDSARARPETAPGPRRGSSQRF